METYICMLSPHNCTEINLVSQSFHSLHVGEGLRVHRLDIIIYFKSIQNVRADLYIPSSFSRCFTWRLVTLGVMQNWSKLKQSFVALLQCGPALMEVTITCVKQHPTGQHFTVLNMPKGSFLLDIIFIFPSFSSTFWGHCWEQSLH